MVGAVTKRKDKSSKLGAEAAPPVEEATAAQETAEEQPPQDVELSQDRSQAARGVNIALLLTAWALSLVLAYILGANSRPQPQTAAATNASSTTATPASVKPTMDPEIERTLKSLPRRQVSDMTALGKVDAPVVLIEWSDYRCPFCAVWNRDTLPQLKKYVDEGTLRIEFRDHPIFGQESVNVAVAARAAGKQGKFWEYQKAVFDAAPRSGHPKIDGTKIVEFAKKAGVADLKQFAKDLEDPKLLQAVAADGQQARSLGINGTPFFVVNTQVINGAQPVEAFIKAIETAKAQ